jgi:hypothetical protein
VNDARPESCVSTVVASWPNAWTVGVVVLFPAQRMGIAAKRVAGRPNTRIDRMERMRGREFDAVVLTVNCVPEDDPSLSAFFRDALPFAAALSRSLPVRESGAARCRPQAGVALVLILRRGSTLLISLRSGECVTLLHLTSHGCHHKT